MHVEAIASLISTIYYTGSFLVGKLLLQLGLEGERERRETTIKEAIKANDKKETERVSRREKQ